MYDFSRSKISIQFRFSNNTCNILIFNKMYSLYSLMYPVCWTDQSVLHFIPWQTCSFWHKLDFSGKQSSHGGITREEYSIIFPPPYIDVYSFIQLNVGLMGQHKSECFDCNGVEPVRTPEIWGDIGRSKGGIDSDVYEKKKAGMVRARQKKIWNWTIPSNCWNEDGEDAP